MKMILLLLVFFINTTETKLNVPKINKLIYFSYNIWYDDDAIARSPRTKKYYKPYILEYIEINFDSKICKYYKADTVWYKKNNYKTYKIEGYYSNIDLTQDNLNIIQEKLYNKKSLKSYTKHESITDKTYSIIYNENNKYKTVFYDNSTIPADLKELHNILTTVSKTKNQRKVDNFKLNELIMNYKDSLYKYSLIPVPPAIEK